MKKHFLPILFILIFCTWSLRSIFHSGFMYSHDSLWHVQRIQNMYGEVREQFPLRWSPSLDNGYGIPLFNFTYPAPYYAGAILMWMGLGPVKSYYLLLFLSYFAGGVGIYLLSRRRIWGLIAAILYLLTPYQFLDIFVRGALGEVVAIGLFPWILLVIQKISDKGRISWFSPIPYALLLLSHNFYSYLFTLILCVIISTLYSHKIKIAMTLVASVFLAAFFIIPAFFERSTLLITTTASQIGDHFLYPRQLIYSPWSYLGSKSGESPVEMSFQLGLANILIFGLGLAYLIFKSKQSSSLKNLKTYLLLLVFCIFMTLPYSDWFWQHIPLISSIQFPWRFLGIANILVALVYLSLATHLFNSRRNLFLAISLFLLVVALINTRNYGRPVKWLNQDEFMALHYEYAGGTTTAHREEIVPRWAGEERHNSDYSLVLSPGVELISKGESNLGIAFQASAPDDKAYGVYHRNYYPMWQLKVDKNIANLDSTDTGEITFKLQPGTHEYIIELRSTILQKVSNTISLVSFFALILLAYRQQQSQHQGSTLTRRTSKRGN